MDSWWAELKATQSLRIQKNHQENLEELTGCNPILLRSLLSASRIIPGSQSPDSVEHYTETIGHLSATVEESVEVENVREDILVYVAEKHKKANLEPAEWKSYVSSFPKCGGSGACAKWRLVLLTPHSPASSEAAPRKGSSS
jgi:hypothetical protein